MILTVAFPENVPTDLNAANANFDKKVVINYLNVLNIASVDNNL